MSNCSHFLLWTSCSVTHRRPFIYSQPVWLESDWCDLSCKSLVSAAARLPPLLEEYDNFNYYGHNADIQDLLQRLVDIVVEIESLGETENFMAQAHSEEHYRSSSHQSTPTEVTDDSFCAVIMTGYSSSFIQHAGIAAWEIMRSRQASCPYPTPRGRAQLTDECLREGCERHLVQICKSIDELANDRFGMITASPLLFLLDSAWMGYRALQDFCGYDLEDVKPWFVKIGNYVTGTGYRPLREPWLAPNVTALTGVGHEVASL